MIFRKYGKRLRYLAHIIRKARGLAESCHPEVAEFGKKVLENLRVFIKGIYEARGDPTKNLLEKFSQELAQLKELSQQHQEHNHDKAKKLARELLNDWDAIWKVLEYPELPITNNIAERSLRHWVKKKKISHGTRTEQGSRAYTLLASVIDTCRQRGVAPWPYIAEVIAERCKGNAVPHVPPIPQPVS
ncbi:MAG: transposase [Chloroflexi bacterium]|nr:transposase [Chloroflexota bacterium]